MHVKKDKLSRHKSYLGNVKVQRNKKRELMMWRDMIPLRTWLGLLTCVRASILCFNCSSISGNLAYWASFCSASSSFSCIAAIFSSWSFSNVYSINDKTVTVLYYNMEKEKLKLTYKLPLIELFYAAIPAPAFHWGHED